MNDERYWPKTEATYRRCNEALRGTNAFDSQRSASPLPDKGWSLKRCSLNPRPFLRIIGRKTDMEVVTVIMRLREQSSAGNPAPAVCYIAETRIENLTMK